MWTAEQTLFNASHIYNYHTETICRLTTEVFFFIDCIYSGYIFTMGNFYRHKEDIISRLSNTYYTGFSLYRIYVTIWNFFSNKRLQQCLLGMDIIRLYPKCMNHKINVVINVFFEIFQPKFVVGSLLSLNVNPVVICLLFFLIKNLSSQN